jgi:hypothetical protein
MRRVEGIQHLEVSESCRKECMQESSLRLRVTRKLRRDKSFEAIEGSTKSWSISSDSRRQRFESQLIKSRKESLVHFVNVSRRRRQTVKILWRGFTKSRQPSDPPEKRGGYSYVRGLSSRDCGPSNLHIVTRQSSDLAGVAPGLSLPEQRGKSGRASGLLRHREFRSQEFKTFLSLATTKGF